MSGRVKQLIDELCKVRARGSPGLEHFVRAHLMLNGIDPTRYTESSPDDYDKEQRLQAMISDFRELRR
jgi:hypothetical protein